MIEAKAGNTAAFGQLVEIYGPRTYRLCYSIVRSHADAEDAAQEAFIRAWRDLPNLRDAAAWPDWLRRIATRLAIDVARRNQRRLRLTVAEPRTGPDFAIAYGSRQELESAFARLKADDRALLVLRFYLDLEVPEVASVLGIPLGTAKSRLHRALGRLRQVLEDEA